MNLRPTPGNTRALVAAAMVCAIAARPERGWGQADIDEPIAGPIDPRAQNAPPREVSGGAGLPDVPDRAPDTIAVMAFENHASHVRSLDWGIAGIPLSIGEKLEDVVGLLPTWGPWVVPEGPVAWGNPTTVAAFAAKRGAKWIVTGWYERPNWQMRLHVILWKYENGVAAIAAEHDAIGPMANPHALVGEALLAIAQQVGWKLPDDAAARLAAAPGKDPYAYTLLGRGVGRWLGAVAPGAGDLRAQVERDLVRAVFIDPGSVQGQRLLGELWATDADPKKVARAAGKFAHAVDLQPDYVPALKAAAERARAAGKREIALDLFSRLVRRRPWDLDARIGVGDAAWQSGDAELALRELGRVVDRRPDDLRARRLLALIRGARGDVAGLARELEEVTRLAPLDFDAWVDLGAAYAELGRLPDATKVYEHVAAARPADPTAAKRVADVWRRRGDVAQAVAWYGKTQTIAPDDPRPVFLIGATYFDAKRWDEARKSFIRAQRHPKWLGHTYVAIGATAWHEGKTEEALWYWRRAAQKRPRSVVARYDLAMAASARGLVDLARGQLDVLDGLAPKDAGAAYLRGVVLAKAGDGDGARAAFSEALRRDPDHADARWNLGVLGRGGDDLRGEGAPRMELPFGDLSQLRAALDRFGAVAEEMAALRAQVASNVLAALVVIGEGPSKDVKAARKAPRVCPLVTVAARWDAAHRAMNAFLRAGLELEEAYGVIVTYDDHGETASLGPAQRQKVAAARSGYRAAQADVRELRGALNQQLGRELTRRGCRPELLAAAAAQPNLYRTVADDAVRTTGTFVPRPPPTEPAAATFYIDNRACREPLSVYVDGTWLGEVPAGQRSALQARVGRRTLCLLPQPSSTTCGDRGTVREVYLHDGWAALLQCPADAER